MENQLEQIKLANNDGLDFDDFVDWFKQYDLTKPMAVIHFTNFRYYGKTILSKQWN